MDSSDKGAVNLTILKPSFLKKRPWTKESIYSWVARDVTKNVTKKLSILLSFYFHEVLQYLHTFT